MKNTFKLSALTALVLGGSATSLMAEDQVESFLDSSFAKLEETVPGKFNVNARVRYEEFDQSGAGPLPDGGPKDRDGTSVRVRYGYTTPVFSGFTAMVEGETTARIGGDATDIHFLDNAGDGTDLNQLWIQYKDADYGSVKVGRQIYALDDHRFIGHVGWRQNIQTFDAATAEYTGIDKLSIKAFHLAGQNGVNGMHNELNANGVNISYAISKGFKLTGFRYNIEGDDTGTPGNAAISNSTVGLRATGSFGCEKVNFVYSVSVAEQEDRGPSGLDYDAGYKAFDIAATCNKTKVTLGVGAEIMEPMFRTPLATVHKFNGFADALLPLGGFTNGLEDYYVYAAYKIPVGNGIKLKAIYHWFDSETGGAAGEDGGSEIDLVASYKINKYLSVLGKYGDYETDGGVGGGAGAADKRMFTFEVAFNY